MTTASEPRPADADKLDSAVLKVAAVVVLGSVMAILDTTVVNVALQALTLEFETSFDTIQWIATGYMLALATVIPVTGWACDRFGTKRLYMLAITFFLVGSALAGAAWDIESLIMFRVLQGLGGGMLMPAGMTILTKTAGPHRVGRVMAVLDVPMLLGPIGGPILGGWLVDSVSWRWIFYINVPIGIVAILLAWRLLPKDEPRPAEKFDFARLGPFTRLAFNMHGLVEPEEWLDIMPQMFHVHAKFYDIDENGDEPAMDIPRIVKQFVEGSYTVYLSSEWEGHAFSDLGESDPIDLVKKQHDLMRRAIEDTAVAV